MSDESRNFFNYSKSSLISDNRLTLTDLFEINLIDHKNGLIINPLNGDRLTISDAIHINLINPNIKEIFNTFKEPSYENQILSNTKFSINEAISLSILDPLTNTIHLSSIDPDLKVNIYQAAKSNIILKPLSLSEAFIRNLIRSDGFVRNPFDKKFYKFKDLVNGCIRNNSIKKCYFFDLDIKHISICFNSNQKLLSIRETIEQGLILPYSFQINSKLIEKCNVEKVNIYEAVFTKILSTKFYLLLYKPIVQNFIRVDKNECNLQEKIGLNEAVNLKLVNFKNYNYFLRMPEENITLDEAVYKNKTIDRQLLDILKFPIVIKTYILSFNNYHKQFNKNIHKTFKEEVLSFNVDSKINYVIKIEESNQELAKNPSLNRVINNGLFSILNLNNDFKTVYFETTLAVHSIKDAKNGNFYSIDRSIERKILDKNKFLIKNSITSQELTLIDAFNKGFIKGFITTNNLQNNPMMKKNGGNTFFKKELDQNIFFELEEKCFKIKAICDPKKKRLLSIKQAVNEGLFDETTGTYTNPLTKIKMNLNQASTEGLILVDSSDCLKLDDESPNSILVIDIINRDEDNLKINTFYYSRIKLAKTLLYEIIQIEEIKCEKPVDGLGKISNELNENKFSTGFLNCFQRMIINKTSILNSKNITIIKIDNNNINSYYLQREKQSVRIFKYNS